MSRRNLPRNERETTTSHVASVPAARPRLSDAVSRSRIWGRGTSLPDLQFDIETPPTAAQRLIALLPRVAFGIAFITIGLSKFDSSGSWVRIFEQIGFGQWFRYFTGAIQVIGGGLMLVRRTTIVGALMVACTMAGATVADLFYLHAGPAFVIPLVLFAGAIAIGWQRWAE
jgi:putative oxidoreductase